jgi:superfamily II DNA helicase RecQ
LVDVQERLEALVCKGAQFRSVQQPAMRAIMQQKSPIVVVMGTGAGKSMLFMLPASCSTGVTIVVVPLVSLSEDLTRRCVEAGIECVQWRSRHPDEWASIVLVTPELAVSKSFGNFINRQRAMGRLDRIVIDECHVVLDSTKGWRTKMLALRDLVKMETQLVYLTATMRPSEEGQFIKLMGLPGKEISHWFRGVTTKKNVGYKVVLHDKREEEETVVKLVQEKKNEYPMPGQIIVYCDTVEKAKRLADVLGCVCFHRNVGTASEKSEILKQLTEGRQQVFTATNALGLGVDAPTIRVVIHVGMVRKLRDYMQESGRAGRDGLKSEAIILRGITYNEKGEMKDDYGESRWVEPSMMEFMATEGCMRVVADREMDGRMDRVGCEDGEERCDGCGKAEVEQESSESGMGEIGSEELEEEEFAFEQEQIRRRIVAHKEVRLQGSQAVGLQGLEDKLEEWRVGCVMCRAFGKLADGHVLDECSRQGAEGLKYWVGQVRETIRWQRFAGCWYCGLPQAVCERWESNDGLWRRVAGGECQFAGVLIESVMAVWYARSELLEGYIYLEMGLEAGKREEFDVILRRVVLWFGQKVRVCGVEGSNICEVFRRFG